MYGSGSSGVGPKRLDQVTDVNEAFCGRVIAEVAVVSYPTATAVDVGSGVLHDRCIDRRSRSLSANGEVRSLSRHRSLSRRSIVGTRNEVAVVFRARSNIPAVAAAYASATPCTI